MGPKPSASAFRYPLALCSKPFEFTTPMKKLNQGKSGGLGTGGGASAASAQIRHANAGAGVVRDQHEVPDQVHKRAELDLHAGLDESPGGRLRALRRQHSQLGAANLPDRAPRAAVLPAAWPREREPHRGEHDRLARTCSPSNPFSQN